MVVLLTHVVDRFFALVRDVLLASIGLALIVGLIYLYLVAPGALAAFVIVAVGLAMVTGPRITDV